MRKITIGVSLVLFCFVAQAQDATSQPAVVHVSDKDGMAANMNKEAIVEGTVTKAEWSRSGAVMNIDFKDAEQTRFLAVIFVRQREKMDTAFGGDVGKALTGAKVRLKGKLQEYGGRSEAFKGRPQIILTDTTQITIVEPAPATQPAS
jgi:DNA/RNA endonuclease YhcR with UshA esterase domain